MATNHIKTGIFIPARYGSSRFCGKPLAVINGKTLIQRVWLIAKASKYASNVYVVTDNEKIYNHCKKFGANVIMTGDCSNGTERIYHAIQTLPINEKPDICMNLQGDAVLTPPWVIDALFDKMLSDTSISICTPAVRMTFTQVERLQELISKGHASETTVTFDLHGNALYFSKSIIPFVRSKSDICPVFQHIGIYLYKKQTLSTLLNEKHGTLEDVEQLEQLRALEHGIPIKIVVVDYKGRSNWSVDNPEDIQYVEGIIQKEGELIGGLPSSY